MIRFKINPLWCCSVMPDGEMSAKAGGYTDFMGVGGTTGVMSNLEAFAKAHNYTNPEDPLASDNFSIAPMLSQMKDSWENTTKGQQRDVSTKLMYGFLTDVITGFGLVSTATKIEAANRAINKAKSDMSKIIGEDLANEAWEAAFKGFNAEHATDISPEGKLSDQDFKNLLTGVYGFDPSTATQEQKDRYMVEQYYESKNPTGRSMGRDDFEKWVDQEVQNIQGGKYRGNRSREMGLPDWYKEYLRDEPGTTIPQANDQTIPGGDLGNADPTIMGDTGGNTPEYTPPEGIFVPGDIPGSLRQGFGEFVEGSTEVTDQYQSRADQLWDDYLNFEKTYFDKYEDNQNRYQADLDSMPQMNLQMPDTMGGATVPLAPKVHSAMYTDQFNAMNSGIGNQANASLAGMGSRDALSKNMFQTNLANLQNSFLPTQAGMDLYQMERAGQLGIDKATSYADANRPSTLSTWAPVVGGFLSADWGDSSIGEGLWDTGSSLIGSAWEGIFG